MATCLNCGAAIGCGCQGKAQAQMANDGTSCCTKCVGAYNAKHPAPARGIKPSITAPQNVNGIYLGPGRQV